MSIITRIRSSVKPTLRPTAATVVLFDGGLPRKSPGFGRGVLASRPVQHVSYTATDAAWAAQSFSVSAEDRHFDELALESAMLDRYTRGYCC